MIGRASGKTGLSSFNSETSYHRSKQPWIREGQLQACVCGVCTSSILGSSCSQLCNPGPTMTGRGSTGGWDGGRESHSGTVVLGTGRKTDGEDHSITSATSTTLVCVSLSLG